MTCPTETLFNTDTNFIFQCYCPQTWQLYLFSLSQVLNVRVCRSWSVTHLLHKAQFGCIHFDVLTRWIEWYSNSALCWPEMLIVKAKYCIKQRDLWSSFKTNSGSIFTFDPVDPPIFVAPRQQGMHFKYTYYGAFYCIVCQPTLTLKQTPQYIIMSDRGTWSTHRQQIIMWRKLNISLYDSSSCQ